MTPNLAHAQHGGLVLHVLLASQSVALGNQDKVLLLSDTLRCPLRL